VGDAFGALERKENEGGKFEFRSTDSDLFKEHVEAAAGKFALRANEVLEPQVGDRNATSGEPKNPAVVPEPATESQETAQESIEAALARYKSQYENLRQEVRSRCTWEELSSRLNAKEGHYLKLAMDQQDGGELVYVDKDGNPVFRDGGVEPVMKGMNYNDTREALYGKDYKEGTIHHGYEMPDSEEEMREIEKATEKPFVASDNGIEWRSSWMESKKNPSSVRLAVFVPGDGRVFVYGGGLPLRDPDRGVVRLLRVKKMA